MILEARQREGTSVKTTWLKIQETEGLTCFYDFVVLNHNGQPIGNGTTNTNPSLIRP